MLEALLSPISKLLGKVIVDKDQRNALAHEIATMAQKHAQELAMGQLEVNKVEAAHPSLFVAGWRPFLGWGLSFAMVWHFVIAPMITFGCAYTGMTIPVLPVFDMDSMLSVLFGMLGLGGLRTFEKLKGVQRDK
jgi:hypothetical protein